MKDVKVSLFQNIIRSKYPQDVLLMDLLNDIKGGRYEEPISQLRKFYVSDPDKCDMLKRKLPAFTMSGTCTDRKTPATHSGLLQIDLDEMEDMKGMRESLKSDPHVAFGFTSPSGDGLKAGLAIDGSRHIESFEEARRYFRDTYEAEIDNMKSRVQLCFVSYDPELWINDSPKTLNLRFTESTDVVGGTGASLIPPSPALLPASGVASYSVNSIEHAVELSLPTAPGCNNVSLFTLARGLLNLGPSISLEDRLKAFDLWYAQTKLRGLIRNTRNQYQQQFMYSIKYAKKPLQETPVELAWRKTMTEPMPEPLAGIASHFDETPQQILKLCFHMEEASPNEPWFLSCYTLGKLMGLSHVACNRWLGGFVALKILQIVERHTTHKATRYRLNISSDAK